MLPHTHFLFGLLIGLLGYWKGQFDLTSVIVLVGVNVLIDIDHPLSYLRHHGKLKLKSAWNNAVKSHEHERTWVHHPIGIVLVSATLLIISRFYFLAYAAFLGYFIHMFIDYAHIKKETYNKHEFKKIFNLWLPFSHIEIIFDVVLILGNIFILFLIF